MKQPSNPQLGVLGWLFINQIIKKEKDW